MVENRLPNSCCPCRCPDVFCPSTICSLRNLFNLIINLENSINNNRKLFGTLRLKLRDIFRLLDCLGCGYFTNSDLNVYLRNRGIFSTNKDADLLFIRLDKNRNGKIFYGDVEDEYLNGKKNGKVIDHFHNYNEFEGEYLNDERNGFGKEYDGKLLKFEGEYY